MKPYQLLLFDRDGTLNNENRDYHRDLSSIHPYPFAGGILSALDQAGYHLSVVTNQSGVARGYWDESDLRIMHDRMCKEWDVRLQFYICPHHPNDGCACRKPGTQLLEQAMHDRGIAPQKSLMIGDSITDFEAANKAGVDFALALTGRGQNTRAQLPGAPMIILDTVADLREHLI
jgi:D-glycero-D-manno-heptose 1,7-bisphosphate phosphatase